MTGTTPASITVGGLKTAPGSKLVNALKTACAKDGWPGLWRGNGLNVLRAGPQKAIDFFAFELYKVSESIV